MYSVAQQKKIVSLYAKEMEIIKLRVQSIMSASSNIGYLTPAVEFQALQLRKIIEQIVLSSLIVNSDIYLNYYNRLGRDWNIRFICRDIRQINPEYLPIAANNMPEMETIENAPERTISEDDLLGIHEKMGRLLHSPNPFASEIDYRAESKYIKVSISRIINFLSVHTIKLYGENDFLFVIMEARNKDGHVGINWFTKVEE